MQFQPVALRRTARRRSLLSPRKRLFKFRPVCYSRGKFKVHVSSPLSFKFLSRRFVRMVGTCHVKFSKAGFCDLFPPICFSCNLTQNYLKKKQTIKAIWVRFLHNPIQQPHTNSVTMDRVETCTHNKIMYVAVRDLSALCVNLMR